MALVLDTGALIAFDRGTREVAALVAATVRRRDRVVTSSGCVAQAWRTGGARQALLARLLQGVDERALSARESRAVGDLCGMTSTSDVVDAHLAVISADRDVILTSDPEDLRALVGATGTRAQVIRC